VDPDCFAPTRSWGFAAGAGNPVGVAVSGVRQRVGGHHLQEKLKAMGVIFGSIFEAVQEFPELVRQYLGPVVRRPDNFFAALNSAVFSDGPFCYVPKGVRCPIERRLTSASTQGHRAFERTLIIADEGAYVSYLEGCTAPMRDTNQLHRRGGTGGAGSRQIKYSTCAELVSGRQKRQGGNLYISFTSAGVSRRESKISWTQWRPIGDHVKYPELPL